MRTIYKYDIPITGEEGHDIPERATIIHVGNQGDPEVVTMWVEVELPASQEIRSFVVHGTGHKVEDNEVYVGTTMAPLGLVWHLFEVT